MANTETTANDPGSRQRDDYETARRLIASALNPVGLALPVAESDPVSDSSVIVGGMAGPMQLTLRTSRDGAPEDLGPNDVAIVRRASPERLEALRRTDRQFVDVGRGIVRLRLPGLFIDRSDLAIPATTKPTLRGFRNPFGDRASLVTRLLIEHPDRRWGAREIAAQAGVSTMTASHVLRQLEAMSVVDVRRQGKAIEVRLTDVRGLVDHWTRAYDWRRSESLRVHAPIGSPERFLPRLASTLGGCRWALTMHAGASLVAPHAMWDTIHVYVDGPLDDVASAAGWPHGAGKLVLMRPHYADSTWRGVRRLGVHDDIAVVSDIQLVLDLWRYPVRGREQAEVILARLEQEFSDARPSAG